MTEPRPNTGPNRRRSDRTAQQECLRIFNVQCIVRTDRILATAEQRSITYRVAARGQDEHHLRRRNVGGIGFIPENGKRMLRFHVRMGRHLGALSLPPSTPTLPPPAKITFRFFHLFYRRFMIEERSSRSREKKKKNEIDTFFVLLIKLLNWHYIYIYIYIL